MRIHKGDPKNNQFFLCRTFCLRGRVGGGGGGDIQSSYVVLYLKQQYIISENIYTLQDC